MLEPSNFRDGVPSWRCVRCMLLVQCNQIIRIESVSSYARQGTWHNSLTEHLSRPRLTSPPRRHHAYLSVPPRRGPWLECLWQEYQRLLHLLQRGTGAMLEDQGRPIQSPMRLRLGTVQHDDEPPSPGEPGGRCGARQFPARLGCRHLRWQEWRQGAGQVRWTYVALPPPPFCPATCADC